jgi:RNA polymerase sigma factor (sigma-70 family)
MQDAFIRAFGRLGTLRDPSSFPAYLRRTVVNLVRTRHRHNSVETKHRYRLASPDVVAPLDEDADAMWTTLARLPERQRAALVLRFYEDLSEQQTADALGTTVAAVKALVQRGAKALRLHLEEAADED